MRKFNVNVNGTSYYIEVEEIKNDNSESIQNEVSNHKPSNYNINKDNITDGEKVTAPMSGTIVDVKISVGQKISQGDVLFILESMKMENEIKSISDGKITFINVAKSAIVETGDILAIYE